MSFGPMQILVVGFEEGRFTGAILEELRRLREHDVIRLVDLLFVQKDENGETAVIETSDLTTDESIELGALAGALVGLGAAGEEGAEVGALAGAEAAAAGETPLGDDVWFVADTIPPGSSAAIAIIEHRWAIGLRDAIREAGGEALADEWLHPSDLVAAGERVLPT
ncbi:DUF6325 family protein [Conexibacter sp. CPCC 206217]|uniref:DUF6325 family protein n=1 Tax=Conexibacter sp. CPCC 206217 TaxID=3064574 RepID=UPI00271A2C1A|nr:DUF6325 family protein [Conexibacter sp. CPCC 206217]MDO8214204.1 DUF6325 family protein [Conexibacter sp. CPCC 206217]